MVGDLANEFGAKPIKNKINPIFPQKENDFIIFIMFVFNKETIIKVFSPLLQNIYP